MSAPLVILLVGALVATNCALVGSFLVLRRLALLGDAISHAVLPGIVLAFLLTSSRAALPMVIGASALGVLTVLLVDVLQRSKRLREDASIGVVYPALFSIGVILVARYADQVDLDLDCVLFGEIAYAPFDVLVIGGRSIGPKALWVTGATLLVDLAVVLGLYKELKVSTFDPDLAGSLGFSPVALHYILMAAISVTVVGSFESVGAILVLAMLVVPPAAAYLLTDRLSGVLALAVLFGIASAALGYALAHHFDASIAGCMASVAGGLFVLALLLSPRYGVVARAVSHRRVRFRLASQLLLLHLRDGEDVVREEAVAERFGWRLDHVRKVVSRLQADGLVEDGARGLRLTAAGVRSLEKAGTAPLAHSGAAAGG